MRPTALTAAILLFLLAPGAAHAADLQANPSNLSGVFNGAQPGDNILLASGDYGDWTGGAKPGRVTLKPAPGASPAIGINFNNAANITVDGVRIKSLTVTGQSHDLTFSHSAFTGAATIRSESLNNANILLDGNTHENINVCGTCYEGRIQVAGLGNNPSGVTIQNSRIGPGGDADGIQLGARGVKVLNNEFVGIKQVSATHTDSLQLYGAKQTVIQSNYFHDFSVAIMAPDGGENEVIANNVFDGDGSYRAAVQLGSQNGTQFVHNTVRKVDVFMDRKNESPSNSTNGVLRDNVLVDGTLNAPSGKCSNCTVSHNLFSSASQAGGSNAIVAMPAFTAGGDPSTWAGHLLAAGSPGKNTASDQTDRGINGTAPAPAPAPAPATGSATPRAQPKPKVRRAAKFRYTPSPARTGRTVTLTAANRTKRGRKCTWTIDGNKKRKGCRVTVRFKKPGTKRVTLTVTDRGGRVSKRTLTVRVARGRR